MGFCHSGLVSSDHYVLCKAALVVGVTRWIFFWAHKFVKHYVCLFSLLCFEDESPAAQTSSSPCALTMAMENQSLTSFRDITEERENCHDMSCVVCLTSFKNRDQVWKLSNCSHVFHKQCLERWLRYDARMTCPLCRTSLITTTTQELPPQQPSWAVERILYLFGDDLLYSSPYSS